MRRQEPSLEVRKQRGETLSQNIDDLIRDLQSALNCEEVPNAEGVAAKEALGKLLEVMRQRSASETPDRSGGLEDS